MALFPVGSCHATVKCAPTLQPAEQTCIADALTRQAAGGDCEKLGCVPLFTFFTERPKERLSLDYTLSNTIEIKNGKLTGKVLGPIVDTQTKAAKLREQRDALQLSREQVIAFGDGTNDLAMMAESGVSIAYHAKPVVREKATYCFDCVGLDGLLNLYP